MSITSLPPGPTYNKYSSVSPLTSLFIYKHAHFLKQMSYTHCSENTMKILFCTLTHRLTLLFQIATQSYASPSMTMRAEIREGMTAGSEVGRLGSPLPSSRVLATVTSLSPGSIACTTGDAHGLTSARTLGRLSEQIM